METYNYLMTDVRIGIVSSGDNKGHYFVDCKLRWIDPDTKLPDYDEKPTSYQLWDDLGKEKIEAIRSVYPKTGKDPEGNEWNGTADIDPSDFDVLKAQKTLRNYQDRDWLVITRVTPVLAPLGGMYCMKYSRNMNGHQKDEWVCGKDGFVKVWTEKQVLVRYKPNGSYFTGWELPKVVERETAKMYSLSAVLKANPELVDPRFKAPENDVIPSNSSAAEGAPEEER